MADALATRLLPADVPALALVSHDTVYHCPHCGGVVLRTSNDQFQASGVRCPQRRCRKPVRLGVESVPHGRRYHCKVKSCRAFLFESPTPVGRVWINCQNFECRHFVTPQVVYLGQLQGNYGRQGLGPPPRIVGRALIVIGAPRQRVQKNGRRSAFGSA